MGHGPLQFLLLPWNLTMHAAAFTDRGFNPMLASFGPLLVVFLLALLHTPPVGRPGLLLLFAVFFTALWFVMSQNSRYLIPLLPGLCAAVGLSPTGSLRAKVSSPR